MKKLITGLLGLGAAASSASQAIASLSPLLRDSRPLPKGTPDPPRRHNGRVILRGHTRYCPNRRVWRNRYQDLPSELRYRKPVKTRPAV